MLKALQMTVWLMILAGIMGCGLIPKRTMTSKDFAFSETKVSAPFIPQEENMCGPTVLAMLAQHYSLPIDYNQLKTMTYTPNADGTFKGDMISAARRAGLAPYSLKSADEMFLALESKQPVVVFQNLAVSWWPVWHYALLTGYDVPNNQVILHSGDRPHKRVAYNRFLRTWERGGSWSYLFTPPHIIPKNSDSDEVLVNGILFEKLGLISEAEALYRSMERRWPNKMEPKLALANIFYSKKQNSLAIQKILEALKIAPRSPSLHFNLAHYYWESGQTDKAHLLKNKTLELSTPEEREKLSQRFSF